MYSLSCNLDVSVRSWRETRVDDVVAVGVGLIDVSVDLFAGFHETVAEMGVLVEGVSVSGKSEHVFVVSRGEGGGREGQGWFKDDLS
jgi:hypothetical protein